MKNMSSIAVSIVFLILSVLYFIDKEIAFGCLWLSQSVLWFKFYTSEKKREMKEQDASKEIEKDITGDGEEDNDQNRT